MKYSKALILILFSVLASTGALNARPCEKAWVFYDLGNTIVDTKTSNFKRITYMPGAQKYIYDLKDKGYTQGLIINVPESWGATHAEKMIELKKFLRSAWVEPQEFPWDIFGANVLLPPTDADRKPAPFLFRKAFELAKSKGCAVVYQGEVKEEVDVAKAEGMITWRVGQEAQEFFMPEEKLRDLL